MNIKYEESDLKWGELNPNLLDAGDVITAISETEGTFSYLIAKEEHSGVYNLVNIESGELIGGNENLESLISENIDEDEFEIHHTFIPQIRVKIK